MTNDCSIDVYNGCRMVGNQLYVTGQPTPAGYQQLAAAGVQSVLCIRNMTEQVAPPAPPPDPNEATALLALNVLYADTPVTHNMTQAQFNESATVAAASMLIQLRSGLTLMHCSSGDRASAVFAVALIATGNATNVEAEAFAIRYLLLADPGIKTFVLQYQTPPWFGDLWKSGALGGGELLAMR